MSVTPAQRRPRQARVALALGLVAALVVGCGIGPGASPSTPSPPAASPGLAIAAVDRVAVDPAEAALAADAINDFGLALLRAAGESSENAVLSPASVVIALAMARPGARGTTATQMDAVLREVASDDHPGWLNALDAALATRSGTFKDRSAADHEVILRIANSPFAQRGYPWEAAYLAALAERFGVGVRLVDYVSATEAARRLINGWVNERTEDRIPELLEPGMLSTDTRLVLVNAIYLKAAWLAPFREDATAPAPFVMADGTTVDVPTMQLSADVAYGEGPGWRAVELPYVGGQLAMTVIVPDDLAAFEAGLDGDAFGALVDGLAERQVGLALPKFGLETKVDLATVLAAMGMPDAFSPRIADFGGMTAADRLFIKAVIHQANIDVDEAGSEAAAATAVVIDRVSAGIEFKVDRPFLFALRDVPTGAILFLGHVTEPIIRN
ncbi:MAG TPA: serpin family protein [Candidatus Deferrimicrobiaceae bacterium]|nr:serpin family protein [Candidatus Deferrimicrobiaceae bacterium]